LAYGRCFNIGDRQTALRKRKGGVSNEFDAVLASPKINIERRDVRGVYVERGGVGRSAGILEQAVFYKQRQHVGIAVPDKAHHAPRRSDRRDRQHPSILQAFECQLARQGAPARVDSAAPAPRVVRTLHGFLLADDWKLRTRRRRAVKPARHPSAVRFHTNYMDNRPTCQYT
jgi:hypothetical protein